MILLDANVLLYAVNSASEHHHLARKAMVDSFANARGVGLAWTALLAFLRLSTRAGIFERPLTIEQALQVIAHWLDQPRAHTVNPTAKHPSSIRRTRATHPWPQDPPRRRRDCGSHSRIEQLPTP